MDAAYEATPSFSNSFRQNPNSSDYTLSVNFGTSLGKPKLND